MARHPVGLRRCRSPRCDTEGGKKNEGAQGLSRRYRGSWGRYRPFVGLSQSPVVSGVLTSLFGLLGMRLRCREETQGISDCRQGVQKGRHHVTMRKDVLPLVFGQPFREGTVRLLAEATLGKHSQTSR